MEQNTIKNVIDWEAVMKICCEEDIAKQIMDSALQCVPQSVEALGNAIKENNQEDITLYAHRLKGTAKTIGADHLAEIAYVIESAGQPNDLETAASAFEKVKSEVEKIVEFLSLPDWLEIIKQQR
jgi:HPt (histidine-containing phosphotransfer) domain-containing protein